MSDDSNQETGTPVVLRTDVPSMPREETHEAPPMKGSLLTDLLARLVGKGRDAMKPGQNMTDNLADAASLGRAREDAEQATPQVVKQPSEQNKAA